MRRTLIYLLCFVLFVASECRSQDTNDSLAVVFPRDYSNHLASALACMNMTLSDAGFKKDYAESKLILSTSSNCLRAPLKLCDMAGEAIAAVVPVNSSMDPVYIKAIEWLDCDQPRSSFSSADPIVTPDKWPAQIDEQGRVLLKPVLSDLNAIDALLKQALKGLSDQDKQFMAANYLGGLYEVEDDAAARSSLAEEGVDEKVIGEVIDNWRDLDAEPHSSASIDRMKAIDLSVLLEAGMLAGRLVLRVEELAAGMETWPEKPVVFEHSLGNVVIGSRSNDVYDMAAILVVDPAGDDLYRGKTGAANGIDGRDIAIIVDLEGDDQYRGSRLMGPASALFGVAVLLDSSGSDTHRNVGAGSGAGVFGVAGVLDKRGDDVYESSLFCQGAGISGFGFCRDMEGNDTYRAGGWAQGFGATRGIGWLIDTAGNDLYYAGGEVPDYERHTEHCLSMAQGCSTGARPSAGGGIGLLTDLAGNDAYLADVFGQGVSYWYSVGMLIDLRGHDTYSIHEYGQGSGIHLSSALLYDGTGNDSYSGHSLSQGNAHDFAVGIMIDGEGNDLYTADHYSQGRGINNSFALLCDGTGKDSYFARKNGQCQGRGHHNRDRGYGSLSVLMDLAGEDSYTGGATNGMRVLYPDYGVLYDFEGESGK